MHKTVTAFLRTAEFRAAAGYNGNGSTFVPDSDGRIGIEMRGSYTVEEMRTLLDDLQRVQNAYNVWKFLDADYEVMLALAKAAHAPVAPEFPGIRFGAYRADVRARAAFFCTAHALGYGHPIGGYEDDCGSELDAPI